MKLQKILLLFLSITLFSCTEENNYYNTEKLGRVNIYIEGNITNDQLVEKLNNELGVQTENIYMERTSLVTDVVIDARISENLRKIVFADSNTGLKNITITGKGNIRTLSLSSSYNNSYINIKGFKEIDIVQLFTLSEQNINKTTNILIEDLEIVNSQLTFCSSEQNGNSISLPDLKMVLATNFEKSYWRGKWDIINMPLLEEMSSIYTSSGGSFTGVPNFQKGLTISELYLPKLKKLRGFIAEDTGVGSFNFPIVEEIGSFSIHIYSYFTSPALYHDDLLKFPMLNTCYAFYIEMPNLNSQAVNYYLHRFLNIYPLSASSDNPREIGLYGEPPTGQGLIDKQTLIDNGNLVGTN